MPQESQELQDSLALQDKPDLTGPQDRQDHQGHRAPVEAQDLLVNQVLRDPRVPKAL